MISNIAGLHQPPSPSDFDGLPYPPGKMIPPTFFIKTTAKDVKRDYLDALGHFF